IAEALGVSVPAVKSLLQRARGRLDELDLSGPPGTPDVALERALLDRYIAAFEAADAAAIRAVIHDDFSLESVPHPTWFQGVDVCLPFLERRVFAALGGTIRLRPTRSNGQPAIASYRRDPTGDLRADGLWVLTIADGRISRAIKFHAPGLVESAGLPTVLREGTT
ncbi:MAG: nuclear transport factor 2 family protein, partial [Actinomycetes bacterium]